MGSDLYSIQAMILGARQGVVHVKWVGFDGSMVICTRGIYSIRQVPQVGTMLSLSFVASFGPSDIKVGRQDRY